MDLEESMLLWIPNHSESIEESDDLNQKVTAANEAVIDFCDRIITFDEFLQTIEYYGASVDDYRCNFAETLLTYGV